MVCYMEFMKIKADQSGLIRVTEEAALRLGQDREFVTRLVEWSACEEHPGVKGITFFFDGAISA